MSADELTDAKELARLGERELHVYGEEVTRIAALHGAGLPIAPGWVVPLARALDLARAVLDEDQSIRLRPWDVARVGGRPWPLPDEALDLAALQRVTEAVAKLSSSPRRAGETAWVRVLRDSGGVYGRAQSVHPVHGDPELLAVWIGDATPWSLERRTMRPVEVGRGALGPSLVERAADLVDRAQLVLGHPVELEWIEHEGRPHIARVVHATAPARFGKVTRRQVALLWHDEGPITPLSVDALDAALRSSDDLPDVQRVSRVYARAYRRLDAGAGRVGERQQGFFVVTARAGRVAADIARPLAAGRAFTRALPGRLAAFDADLPRAMDDQALLIALGERQQVVVEAEQLLDRGRKATGAVLGALEAGVGTLPREAVQGLAAMRRARARRRRDRRLQRAFEGSEPTTTEREALRAALVGVRALGLELSHAPAEESDAGPFVALEEAERADRAERAQRQAARRLMATARGQGFGSARMTLVRGLLTMIRRLAVAKGEVADGLASASLRLRVIALEIGRRLAERGILEVADDAFYLRGVELREALGGEPGAYAARVRVRREDDARWRNFLPPSRIVGRSVAH